MMFGKNSEFIESRPIIHYPLMINYGSRRGGYRVVGNIL